MASNYWVKLHHHILDDSRFAKVGPRAGWRWVQCFAYAGDLHLDGTLNTTEVLAWRFRVSDRDELLSDLNKLRDAQLLTQDEKGCWSVVGFTESQAPEPNVKRVQQHRKRKKDERWYPDKYSGNDESEELVTEPVTKRYTDKIRSDNKQIRSEEIGQDVAHKEDNGLTVPLARAKKTARATNELSKPKAIQVFKEVTDRYPLKRLYDTVIVAVGDKTADELTPYFQEWIERGYNCQSIKWLTEWAAAGHIPRPGNGKKTSIDTFREAFDYE